MLPAPNPQLGGQPPAQLTSLQTVTDGVTLGRQETLTWKSDGYTADGVITYPPDYKPGEKRPLVLYIHGGPVSASLQTFTTSSQILAAQGWIVLEPNYRGSNNRGYKFQQSIIGDAVAGPGSPLVVYGDTSQDGVWYQGNPTRFSLHDFGQKPWGTQIGNGAPDFIFAQAGFFQHLGDRTCQVAACGIRLDDRKGTIGGHVWSSPLLD